MIYVKQILTILYAMVKEWPKVKAFIGKCIAYLQELNWKKKKEKLDEKLEEIDTQVTEHKNTSGLEDLFAGKVHSIDPVVTKPLDPTPIIEEAKELVSEVAQEIKPLPIPERVIDFSQVETSEIVDEKKKPILEGQHTGAATFFKIVGIGAGLAALEAIFSSKKASASSLGSGHIILDSAPNRNEITGGARMGSKIIGMIVLALMTMNASECKQAINRPNYSPKIWAGDSQNVAITRSQTGEMISTSAREFDNYVAVSYKDMACLYKTYVNNCKEFREAIVDCNQVIKLDGERLLDAITESRGE